MNQNKSNDKLASSADSMEKIVSLCKRRGFVFQSSEIYGGLQGFYDFGQLGVEMKNNLKQLQTEIFYSFFISKEQDIIKLE